MRSKITQKIIRETPQEVKDKVREYGNEVVSQFDKVLATVPKYIMDCPVFYDWLEYKGETYFGVLNYERSVKAGKPMIDLSYCATRAINGCVLKTVQYDKKHFGESNLAVASNKEMKYETRRLKNR